MSQKESPHGGQQESSIHFITTDKPEPSLEQQAQRRAEQRRKAGGNGEVPPNPSQQRDPALLVRRLLKQYFHDPDALDAALQALAEETSADIEALRRLEQEIRLEIQEQLDRAAGKVPPAEEPVEQGGDGHDDEPPRESPPPQEFPPIDSYINEYGAAPRQDQAAAEATDDTWPRLEPDDKPPHIGTDQANGYLIARHIGHDLLYVIKIGWHAWRNTHWCRGEEFAYRKAQRLSRLILDEAAAAARRAAKTEDTDKRKRLMGISESLAGWAKKSEGRDRIYSAMTLARPMLAIEHDDLDQDHWLLNCLNGTLNLQTGTLHPHRRADFITRCIPVAYNPQATCPTWLAFLNRIFDHAANVIHFVRKALGYSLTGDTSEQCVFFLHGIGANGKSTLLATVQALMGAYAQQAAPDLLVVSKHERHPTEIAELRGARLVASIETGEGRRLNESLIKQMSGGDKMRGHFMRQDNFEFEPRHKVFLATNHKPKIRGTDLAIWRRIRLIPFTVTIPPEERDPKLVEKLKGELPGILAWCVQGCLAWQQEGLEPPREVTDATDQYRSESDVLAAFLADCCVIDKSASVKANALYSAYRQWCEQNGERLIETQTGFGLRLTERGFQKRRITAGIVYDGIGLPATGFEEGEL